MAGTVKLIDRFGLFIGRHPESLAIDRRGCVSYPSNMASFDGYLMLAIGFTLVALFLEYRSRGLPFDWNQQRPTLVAFVLVGLIFSRHLRIGGIDVGQYLLMASLLTSILGQVSRTRNLRLQRRRWFEIWLIAAIPLATIIVAVAAILSEYAGPAARERILGGTCVLGVFIVVSIPLAVARSEGLAGDWREIGMLLLPIGVAGLVLFDGHWSDRVCLGLAMVGSCFLVDGYFRSRVRGELRSARRFGLSFDHDGRWMKARDQGIEVRLMSEGIDAWLLEFSVKVSFAPDFAALDGTIPLNVPLMALVGQQRESSPPPSWDGYRLFTTDPDGTRAILAGIPAPRPRVNLLSVENGRLTARWFLSVTSSEEYCIRRAAFQSVATGLG